MTDLFLVLLGAFLVVVAVVLFMRKKQQHSAPPAAGMNFDLESVEPFLLRLSSILDGGFTAENLREIVVGIDEMSEDHEVKDLGTYPVVYRGKSYQIRIEAEIHIEGDGREVVLNLFSTPVMVQLIDEEMMRYADELGI